MLRPYTGSASGASETWQGLRQCSLDGPADAAFQFLVGGSFKGGVRCELSLLRGIAVRLRVSIRARCRGGACPAL
jgi:hypothetical protein